MTASRPPLPPLHAWLPTLALVIHVLEELPRFPDWATRHFGTTTTEWFLISHIPIFLAAFTISARAAVRSPSLSAVWWLLAFQVALATNALFHVGATMVFREYAPGVVSAVVCYVPLTILLVPRLGRSVGWPAAGYAALTGVVLTGVAVASLRLLMDLGGT